MEIMKWSTFAEINQVPSTYSMCQDIGRVAAPKLVARHCLRYLQTTLIMEGGGSENNIDHRGRGIGLRTYVRYCLKK